MKNKEFLSIIEILKTDISEIPLGSWNYIDHNFYYSVDKMHNLTFSVDMITSVAKVEEIGNKTILKITLTNGRHIICSGSAIFFSTIFEYQYKSRNIPFKVERKEKSKLPTFKILFVVASLIFIINKSCSSSNEKSSIPQDADSKYVAEQIPDEADEIQSTLSKSDTETQDAPQTNWRVTPTPQELSATKNQRDIIISNSISQRNLCRAAILTFMQYKNIKETSSLQLNNSSAVVTRHRPEDNTNWHYLCKIESDKIIYASMNTNGPETIKVGRWRVHPADEKITYTINGDQLNINVSYSESDKINKVFSIKKISK